MPAIVYIDRSVIRSPDIAGLRQALAGLTEFVREREPQLLLYGFEIDEQTATMRVIAVHPDAASLALHLSIGGPEFRKVGAYIELQEILVFGTPTDTVRQQLLDKAAMLGTDARVHVGELASGFDRISAIGR
ncbi:MAG TPA: hypothetical protein VFJ71_00260 [Candidatus Limnocylindrales bacterium]|nr:hypothetical protein [Candidatus Limnocylindrales bacterium]